MRFILVKIALLHTLVTNHTSSSLTMQLAWIYSKLHNSPIQLSLIGIKVAPNTSDAPMNKAPMNKGSLGSILGSIFQLKFS